jgi:hypothetical protein
MTAKRFDDHDHSFTLLQDLHAIERRLHDRRRMLEWMLSGATTAVIAACGVPAVARARAPTAWLATF